MNNTLVSIITPSYNSALFIEETILSVKNQIFDGPIEHIIFDGDSNDGTKEILKKYDHLISFSEPDKGQSDAINKGFKISKGKIIGWINSDDTYDLDTIGFVVKYFDENPDVHLIHSDVNIIDDKSNKIGLARASNNVSPMSIISNNPIKQPTIFMRREIIDALNGLDINLDWTMDREFWLRISLHNYKINYIDNKIFSNFRICSGRKSFENPEKMNEEWVLVIKKYFKSDHFSSIEKEHKLSIISKAESYYFLSKMNNSIRNGEYINILKNASISIYLNFSIMFNMGFWKILIFGLLGFDLDRFKKFKKNEI